MHPVAPSKTKIGPSATLPLRKRLIWSDRPESFHFALSLRFDQLAPDIVGSGIPKGHNEHQNQPFGLTKGLSIGQYRADPICHLSLFNYKISAKIGPGLSDLREILTIIDTGAGPNLIRADLLPPPVLKTIDTKREIVNLASASNHRIDVLGIVKLTTCIADQVTRHPFVVARNLGADAILGTQFIDSAVEDIKVHKRAVLLTNGTMVPIIRRRAVSPVTQSLPEPKPPSSRAMAAITAVRCAKKFQLDPGCEHLVPVIATQKGLRLVEARPEVFAKYHISMANGLADIRPDVPFFVKVANFSDKTVTLPKGMRIGQAIKAPMNTEIFAIEIGNGDGKPTTIYTDQSFPSSDSPNAITLDDVDLSDLDKDQKDQAKNMLRPFSDLWNGRLGRVSVAEHNIVIEPETKPVFSQPYR
eukprot:IDg23407t1